MIGIILDAGFLDILAKSIAHGKLLTDSTKEMAGIMASRCMVLAGFFFAIMLALNIAKIAMGLGKKNFHFVWPYIGLFMCLMLYNTLMPMVDSVMDVPVQIAKNIASTVTVRGAVTKKRDADLEKQKTDSIAKMQTPYQNLVSTVGANAAAVGSDVAGMFSPVNPATWAKVVVLGVIEVAYNILQGTLILIESYSISLLYITGPIAITFSFLLAFEGGFVGWLKYYMVIKLWIVIIFLIEALSATLVEANIDPNTGMGSWESTIVRLGLIVMYCMVPKFADILISGSQGGAFFSAAVGIGAKSLGGLSKLGGEKSPLGKVAKSLKEGLSKAAPSLKINK